MPARLRIHDVRLLPGCSAGLAEPTALVEIDVAGSPAAGFEERARAGIAEVYPEQPLLRVSEADWPATFLVGSADTAAAEVLGEWIVAVTVAVQRWAQIPVWRGRVVDSDGGRIRLAIPWRWSESFRGALDHAVRLVGEWSRPEPDGVHDRVSAIREFIANAKRSGVAPTMMPYIQAAVSRDIPFEILPGAVQFGWGARADRMLESRNSRTDTISVTAANTKLTCNRLLANAGIPIPDGEVVADIDSAVRVATRLGWPVVVKPMAGGKGNGVTPAIADVETLQIAFQAADALCRGAVIVEKHIDGNDHRLLVVNGKLLAAAHRTPAGVTGDGVSTVRQLVDLVNSDPRRVADISGMLILIALDDEADRCLAQQGLMLDSVPEDGRWIALRRTGNISTGGTATDVTAMVHPDNKLLAERAARAIGLNIAGVDLLATDIGRSWRETGAAICEVNAQPGLRVHRLADPDRDIDADVLDVLFGGRPVRIPTAAITGDDASPTALLLQRIWAAAGTVAGVCTAEVLRIGDDVISEDDLSGQAGGRILLTDPAVQAAILELPAARVLESGNPCDRCDVAALLSVDDSGAAAEVLERARDAVVFNATDPGCLALRPQASADRHILVGADPATSAGEVVGIGRHDGRDWIIHVSGGDRTPLLPVEDVEPGCLDAALFAAALALAHRIDPAEIRAGIGVRR